MLSCCTKSQNPEKHKSQQPFSFSVFFLGLLTNCKKPKNRNSSSTQPGRSFFIRTPGLSKNSWESQRTREKASMISKSWIFCFVFFEGNLLRECQMNIMSVYWEKRSLLIHSFSTPPKTYPTRKQYRRKKKNRPNTLEHLLMRTGSFHESFAARHKTWGLQFLLVVSNKQNDLPIICWKFLRIRDRTQNSTKRLLLELWWAGRTCQCACLLRSLRFANDRATVTSALLQFLLLFPQLLPSTTFGCLFFKPFFDTLLEIWLFLFTHSQSESSPNFLAPSTKSPTWRVS